MSGIVGAFLGLPVAIFEFLAIRTPCDCPSSLGKTAVINEWCSTSLPEIPYAPSECCYACLVLHRYAGLGATFKARALQAVSDGPWPLSGKGPLVV
jgi:hypothetical protein